MIEISLSTSKRNEFVDITSQVQESVSKSGIKDGMCIVFVPHTTAGVAINEGHDPNVAQDVLSKFEELVSEGEKYFRHAEGNSDSHIKSILTGSSATIIVEGSKLLLGTWQKVFFCEFDGPRKRMLWVKVLQSAKN